MRKLLVVLSLLSVSGIASAKEGLDFAFTGVAAAGVSVDQLPYRNIDPQVGGSLFVMGRSSNLFFEGNRIGYLVQRTEYGAFSVIGQRRTHQYLPKSNGVEREKAIELGGQWALPVGAGWMAQLSGFTDVSSTHNGAELELSAYRRDTFGDVRLLTNFALQAQNQSLTGYYADTPTYTASSDINVEVELIAVYELSESVSLVGVYRHYRHGSGLANSPLTDSRHTQRLVMAVGWSF